MRTRARLAVAISVGFDSTGLTSTTHFAVLIYVSDHHTRNRALSGGDVLYFTLATVGILVVR